jgi:hypothetical protein
MTYDLTFVLPSPPTISQVATASHSNQKDCTTMMLLPEPTFEALSRDVDARGDCLQKRINRTDTVRSYMSIQTTRLDLSRKQIMETLFIWDRRCLHRPSGTQPTLVLVGDFWKAVSSMHRRNLLSMNIAKNLYGAKKCKRKYDHYLKTFPRDPVGFKTTIWIYMNASLPAFNSNSRTVFLQAPYTSEYIDRALNLIGLDDLANQMKGFEERILVVATAPQS